MKIVACYSNKGGVGKTASSVNLAYWASQNGYRTLLVDLDPQGASSFYFRVKPTQKNWGKRFMKAYAQVLKQIKASDYENLDVIPAHESFRHFDILINALNKRKNRLRNILKGLKHEYDLVILDCPPTFSQLAENVFIAADLVLVPVIPTVLSDRTLEQLIRHYKQNDYKRKKLLPFFTMVDLRKKMHREMVASMREKYKRFMRYGIPYSSSVEKMGKHRAPIDIYASNSKANRSYQKIWEKVESDLFG